MRTSHAVEGGWVRAERDLTVTTGIGVVVVLGWSVVETLRALRRTRDADRAQSSTTRLGAV